MSNYKSLQDFKDKLENKKIDLSKSEILITLIKIKRENNDIINKPINLLKYYSDLYKYKENIPTVFIEKNKEGKRESNNLKYSIDLKGELNERNN